MFLVRHSFAEISMTVQVVLQTNFPQNGFAQKQNRLAKLKCAKSDLFNLHKEKSDLSGRKTY